MAEETKEPAAPAAKSSKLLPILVGINSVAVVVVLVIALTGRKAPPAAHAEGAEGAEEPAAAAEGGEGHGTVGGVKVYPTAKISDFVVHLRNPEAERYARCTFEVELNREQDKEVLAALTPRIRDAFIAFLSDRTVEEFTGSEALTKIKTALLAQLETIVPGKRIRALYLTDFVVQ